MSITYFTECPLCGGDSGFIQKYSPEYNQTYDWAGKPIDAELSGSGTESKMVSCADCDGRFRSSTIFRGSQND